MRYALILLFITTSAIGQAIYDANGQYRGYQQTSPSGVTSTYNAQGQSTGTSQIDNGQTNYYSPAGMYQGTNTTTPTPPQVNSNIYVPRQPPQPPSVKGW